MKKLITLILVSIFFFGYAQQKIQLADKEGNPYSHGDEIRTTITANDLISIGENLEFPVEIIVYNQENYQLDVSTIRTNLSLVNGMQAYVCFGVCDDTYELLEMEYSIEERSSLLFSLHLIPNVFFGLNKFKIDFVAESEITTLYIVIDMQPLSVKEQNKDKVSLNAYPNPVASGSKVNISYTLPDKNISNKLIIRNILGSEVLSFLLNPNEKNIAIDTSPLVQGVYFYTIENNNHIYMAKKLIVK